MTTGKLQTLQIEQRGPIEIVTLNRPEVLNALSPEMVAELGEYVTQLKHRKEVRVVILRGSGRAFCAGLDLKETHAGQDQSKWEYAWRSQLALGDVLRAMRTVPQPFVGLGHGAACGGGFSLLLACDVRFGAPSLKMNAAYLRIGLGGADMGSSYFLPRLVGSSIASELLLTGRYLHADRALRIGLLSDVLEEGALLDAGVAMAGEIIANAPYAVGLTKQALNLNIDAPSVDAAFALEDRQQIMLSATDDHQEAMAAFAEKRPPDYQGS